MHIVFYSTASLFESRFLLLLDEAMCHHQAGDRVTFVYCDGCLRYCRSNIGGSSTVCAVCRHLTRKGCAQLPGSVEVLPLSQFLSAEDAAAIERLSFDYSSARDLRDVTFRGADIGYAVLSHYIGMKRNLEPVFTPSLKTLFDNHLRAAARLTAATEKLIDTFQADCYGLFNGRLFDTRGFFRVVSTRNAGEIRCYEFVRDPVTHATQKTHFVGGLPHDVRAVALVVERSWAAATKQTPLERLIQTGSLFFEKRKNNQKSTDPVVYTRNQILGTLPEGWSEQRRNFVFFNSSEDEFASVDREFDQYKYLPSQLDVIKRVATLAHRVDPSIRVYLRIHPNLANVQFDYHHKLNRLGEEHPNLTVIPASSPISTYTLIEHAETVVVVGSTVGIEAVYANKPVILLGTSVYRFLDACYLPRSDDELMILMRTRLPPKDRLAAFKFGYYLETQRGKPWQHFDFSTSRSRVLGIRIPYASCYTWCGRANLYGVAYKLITGVLFMPYHLRRSALRRLGFSG